MDKKSKSLQLIEDRHLEWCEYDLPLLKSGQVLVKTIACAVSVGSEIPVYRGDDIVATATMYPKQMGYESFGEVIATGPHVRQVGIGDRVVGFYGHQDYAVCQETGLIPVPRNIEPSTALLTILSCDAAKGVLKLNPKPTDKVLVTGLGTMGLLTVYFLREYMNVAYVDAVELDADRAALGKLFGVRNCFTDIQLLTDAYDVGFECSARNTGFQTLQVSMKQHGKVCILSDGNYDEFVLHPTFFGNELNIVGSSDGWDYQEHAKWFFSNVANTPYVKELFQVHVTQNSLIQCYEDLAMRRIQPVKVLVIY